MNTAMRRTRSEHLVNHVVHHVVDHVVSRRAPGGFTEWHTFCGCSTLGLAVWNPLGSTP